MNYVKKMCILRQIKQGFSGDGKALSGLIKAEQYGKNIAVEVSVINFAPLVSGEYYCLLSDGNGKTEMLSLRGKSLFNLLTDLDISGGFCGIICYVKNEVVPIAYGINGNKNYDWKRILNAALPPVFPSIHKESPAGEIARSASPQPPQEEKSKPAYDDDTVATENYFKEEENECQQPKETVENAHLKGAIETEGAQARLHPTQDVDAESVRHPFKTDPDGYYLSVKEEVDRLFQSYPRDRTLHGAFSCSEWVRVKGTPTRPQYLVGVLKKEGRVQYICYALAAEDRHNPPAEIKSVCTFVPTDVYDEDKGFFVIFQSAANGECVRPEII